jgi:hypothetical protein
MNNPATKTGAEVANTIDNKLSKTYKEVVDELIETGIFKSSDEINGAKEFAKYLDGNNVMTHELTLLAIQQSRKIDRELITKLVEFIGIDKARDIVREVVNNHRHTKVEATKEGQ